MEAFIKYAKQPSNYEDYWGIFDPGARYKMDRPEELKRKIFFQQQFGSRIMGPFYHHLRLNKLIPGSTQLEIIANIDQGKINHDDLILAFSNWLDQEDTIFVFQEKPKAEPPKPTVHFASQAQVPPKSSNPVYKHSEAKKDAPFLFQKVGNQTTPHKPTTVVGSYPQQQRIEKNARDEERPYRTRFLQKLADYFEYPERVVSIKNQLSQMTAGYRKA